MITSEFLKWAAKRAAKQIRIEGETMHVGPTKASVDINLVETHQEVKTLREWLVQQMYDGRNAGVSERLRKP